MCSCCANPLCVSVSVNLSSEHCASTALLYVYIKKVAVLTFRAADADADLVPKPVFVCLSRRWHPSSPTSDPWHPHGISPAHDCCSRDGCGLDVAAMSGTSRFKIGLSVCLSHLHCSHMDWSSTCSNKELHWALMKKLWLNSNAIYWADICLGKLGGSLMREKFKSLFSFVFVFIFFSCCLCLPTPPPPS